MADQRPFRRSQRIRERDEAKAKEDTKRKHSPDEREKSKKLKKLRTKHLYSPPTAPHETQDHTPEVSDRTKVTRRRRSGALKKKGKGLPPIDSDRSRSKAENPHDQLAQKLETATGHIGDSSEYAESSLVTEIDSMIPMFVKKIKAYEKNHSAMLRYLEDNKDLELDQETHDNINDCLNEAGKCLTSLRDILSKIEQDIGKKDYTNAGEKIGKFQDSLNDAHPLLETAADAIPGFEWIGIKEPEREKSPDRAMFEEGSRYSHQSFHIKKEPPTRKESQQTKS